jgi:probable rRNA maturation factor
MIFVNIHPDLDVTISPDSIEKAVSAVMDLMKVDEKHDITVVITVDNQIQDLNRQFRQIDTSTDVLSFGSGEMDPDTGNTYLGDVIISYPQAVIQAGIAGHPVESELQLLTIHGTLHLFGFDHSDEKEKVRMWSVQSEALGRLGIADLKITE